MELAQTIFYISASLAFWIIVGVWIVIAIEVIAVVRVIKKAINKVGNTVDELEMVKNSIKLGVLSLIGNIVGKKGGEENVKSKK